MLLYLSLFLISAVSGLFAYSKAGSIKSNVKVLLSFSGAYLLGICFLHLLPELFETHNHQLGLYLLFGFVLQLMLDYFSGGIEHGHTHINRSQVGNFPFLIFISLGLHAFLEAFPITELQSETITNSYLIGLLVHKVPIAIILVGLLIKYKLSRSTIIIALLIFSAMAPFGAFVGSFFDSATVIFQQFLAISIGIILHLSTTILLESNEEHQVSLRKFAPLLIGVLLALGTQLLNH